MNTNVHIFRRYGFIQKQGILFNVAGEAYGVIYANGLTSIYYYGSNSVAMPSLSEFTSLFDQYKILSFSIEFRPKFTEIDGATNNLALPTIYWVHDTDSMTTPSTMSELMERKNVHVRRLHRPVRITVKFPCVSVPVYQSAIATSYQPKRAAWIDMNNVNVPHLGVHWGMIGPVSGGFDFDIRVSWTFCCKNQR